MFIPQSSRGRGAIPIPIHSIRATGDTRSRRQEFPPLTPDKIQASDNELDLMVLDPAWLEQYPSHKHEDVFFRSILPRLVQRVAECTPQWKFTTEPLTLPANSWTRAFHEKSFDAEKAFAEYNESRVSHLASLHEYMILERAKVMCERLWAQCREFFLLGLAFHSMGPMGDSKEMKLDMAASEYKSCGEAMHAIRLAKDQSIYSQEFVKLCEEQISSSSNFWSGLYSENTEPSYATGNFSNPEDTIVEHVQKWTKVFVAATNEYRTKRHIDQWVNTSCFGRWNQITALGIKQGKMKDWPGKEVMTNVWSTYRDGPLDTAVSYSDPKAVGWVILSTNVRSLCSRAGSTEIVCDPIQNIANLRQQIGREMVYAAGLQHKIEEMEEEKRLQQRIIATLSFRYLIESLSSYQYPQMSGTDSWLSFWAEAWNASLIADQLKVRTHPLRSLRNSCHGDQKRLNKIDECAKGLYSSLSTYIHRYCHDQVSLPDDQWDPIKSDIFKALKPKDGLCRDVNWETESENFFPSSEIALAEVVADNTTSDTESTHTNDTDPVLSLAGEPDQHGIPERTSVNNRC
ncbi:uncharacterized protein LY89DRAFT_675817 [Mollisia scopiformis]|uniref:Uncharacterized protein n=1 Tax=Mollisia scopiformis TaxID=149040 RepID=A0A132BCB8_MOLSC|nr:uncharacterized protein LY89DRAFT_675817 [Mollisia scopiformis]KUJ09649.1 hypothetical protein LY89DRAFT_675817 [Mollisia scopiformis]